VNISLKINVVIENESRVGWEFSRAELSTIFKSHSFGVMGICELLLEAT